MDDLLSILQTAGRLFLETIKLVEPDERVWIGAFVGSLMATFAARSQTIWKMLFTFWSGVGFAVAFVLAVDHLDPFAEAWVAGMGSGGAVRLIIDGFGPSTIGVWLKGLGNANTRP